MTLTKLRKARSILRKPADQRTLSEKLLISGTLSGIDHAANQVFRLGSTLIVTRLLAPDIFGLFAIVMTVQYILFMITDFGVRSLIIVSDNPKDRDFLRTCWTVQIVRGIGLWGLQILAALGLYGMQQAGIIPGDVAYADPILPLALAANGFQVVLMGLESVNQHVYAREMRMRRITIVNIVQSAFTPLMTIAIALAYPTIWAIVIAGILSAALKLVLSFRMFDGPSMRLRWKRDHVADLFRRGRWIMANSALTAFTNEADQLLLGAFLPAPLLGVYYLARQLISVAPALILKIQGAIGLQVFRELLELPPNTMRDRYYRYRLPIDTLACLAAGMALAAGPALIDLMYDPRYLQAGEILQILAIGLPLMGMSLIDNAFAAQARFKLVAVFGLIRAVSIWGGLLLVLLIFESPTAAFIVIALRRMPEIAVLMVMARRQGWISLRREIRFLPVIGAGALLGWGLSELYFSLKGA